MDKTVQLVHKALLEQMGKMVLMDRMEQMVKTVQLAHKALQEQMDKTVLMDRMEQMGLMEMMAQTDKMGLAT
jgi:hypothetical protein